MTREEFAARHDEVIKMIQDMDAIAQPVRDMLKPFDQATARLMERIAEMEEASGLHMIGKCVTCEQHLFRGDAGLKSSDGELLCEEHAPTLGELDEHYSGMAEEVPCDDQDEELTEAMTRLTDAIRERGRAAKHVYPLDD